MPSPFSLCGIPRWIPVLAAACAFASAPSIGRAITREPAGAPGQVLVTRASGLKGDVLYWFVSDARADAHGATEPRILPNGPAGKALAVAIPPEFDRPGAEMRFLDVSRGRAAHYPLVLPQQGSPQQSSPQQSSPQQGSQNPQIAGSSNLEIRLAPGDFKYVHTFAVPIRFRGSPVTDAEVTLKRQNTAFAAVRLADSDRGLAIFSDVPADEPLTIQVKCQDQSVHFPAIARGPSVAPLALPAYWSDVKTVAPIVRPEASGPFPLIGAWEGKPDASGRAFRFTFNADGTGSISSVDPTRRGPDAGPPRSPVDNIFRWYVGDDSRRIMIDEKAYAWAVTRSGAEEKLVLTGPAGKSHTLFRR